MSGEDARSTIGAGGVAANLHTHLSPPPVPPLRGRKGEGNHKRLKFLSIVLLTFNLVVIIYKPKSCLNCLFKKLFFNKLYLLKKRNVESLIIQAGKISSGFRYVLKEMDSMVRLP